MKKIKKFTMMFLLVFGVVLFVGCSQGNTNKADASKASINVTSAVKSTSDEKTEASMQDQEEVLSTMIDVKRAVEIFYTTFNDKDITITQIAFDKEMKRSTYEIEGWKENKEYKLEIDAENEKILDQEVEADFDIDKNDLAIELDKIISPEKAIEEALKHAQASEIEGWDLETEGNMLVYEVDVKGGRDVVLSAQDGSLIKLD